jgi:hypothetical protein
MILIRTLGLVHDSLPLEKVLSYRLAVGHYAYITVSHSFSGLLGALLLPCFYSIKAILTCKKH